MKKKIIVGLTILIMLASSSLAGATNLTARAFGMGGAFTGIADDVTSVLYNPAGLSQSGFFGLQFNGGVMTPSKDKLDDLTDVADYIDDNNYNPYEIYNKFPEGARFDGQLLMGANLKSIGLALNFNDKFETTKKVANEATIENTTTSEGIVSFGKQITNPPLSLGALAIGANVKMMRTDYSSYTINTNSAEKTKITADGNGFGLDLGLIAKVTKLLTVGAQIRNAWAQNYDITGKNESNTYDVINHKWNSTVAVPYNKEISPDRVMRVGASFHVPVINATLAADIDNFPLLTEGDKDMIYHFGFEKSLFWNGVTLRAGTFNQPETNGSQFYTLGVGLNVWAFHVDAALGSDDGFDDNRTGIIAANMKF